MSIRIHKNLISLLYFSSILTILACSNYSKEDYLTDYHKFIFDIKSNWKKNNEDKWEKLDKQNNHYSVTQYEKFNKVLTPSEKLRVRRFDFAYHFYRGDITASMILTEDYHEIFKNFSIELLAVAREIQSFKNDIRTQYMTGIIDQMLSE